jgi:DNA (cytosine-5)-methyltransferase 1
LLLDLFCGAGGAAMGYHRAGFDVIGIDINPQPDYPFGFVQGDALDPPFDLCRFNAIHASPPCQLYSVSTVQHRHNDYPDLVAPTRRILVDSGLPWIIENVPGAPLVKLGQMTFDGRSAFMLCGSMFGLERVRRHRIFETNTVITEPGPCRHHEQRDVMSIVGHSEQGSTGRRGDHWGLDARREAMGMPWASRDGVSEAIPPAYTEFIGRHLIAHIQSEVAA